MSITDGSAEYELKTTSSIEDLNISNFAHTFLDDTSADEVRNTLDLISKNELGYRQKNKIYNVGDIAYHKDLPVGYYLRCTTAGTTSNNNLIITNNTKGIYFNDGTVTWNISDIKLPEFSKDLLHYIITLTNTTPSDLNMTYNSGFYRLANNTLNNPTNDYGFCLVLGTSSSVDLNGYHMQIVWGQNGQIYYRNAFHPTEGIWNDWKRIPTANMLIQKVDTAPNGYIKFGSLFGGLTIQWGNAVVGNGAQKIIDLPIAFSYAYRQMYVSCQSLVSGSVAITNNGNLNQLKIMNTFTTEAYVAWLAIGC